MPRQDRKQFNEQQENWTPTLTPEMTECMEFLGAWNQSLLGFYIGRLQQYWKLPFEVHPFSTSEEYIQLHERFLKKMITDYAEHAEELMAIAGREQQVSRDPIEPGYEHHLLKAQEDAAKIIEQAKAQAERIIASAEDRAGLSAQKAETQTETAKRRSA